MRQTHTHTHSTRKKRDKERENRKKNTHAQGGHVAPPWWPNRLGRRSFCSREGRRQDGQGVSETLVLHWIVLIPSFFFFLHICFCNPVRSWANQIGSFGADFFFLFPVLSLTTPGRCLLSPSLSSCVIFSSLSLTLFRLRQILKDGPALGLTISDNGAGYAFIKKIREDSIMVCNAPLFSLVSFFFSSFRFSVSPLP